MNCERVRKKNKFRVSVRTRACNIITEQTGVKDFGKNTRTPKECWSCFSSKMLNLKLSILEECRNKYINDTITRCSRDRDSKQTSKKEIWALTGFLYNSLVYKSRRQNLNDIWVQDGIDVDIFHATMSIRRS